MPERVPLSGRIKLFLRKYVFHGRVRCFLGSVLTKMQSVLIQPNLFPYFVTYLPHKRNSYSYVVRKTTPLVASNPRELPMPPRNLWVAYGPTVEQYLNSGKSNVDTMRTVLGNAGFTFPAGSRVMEFGCSAGRMLRWLHDVSDRCEVWGTDITGEHIVWCKQNLQPPFHFFVTTTSPHLPFADNYFDLLYAGSVFTHIDDLAETWLLEMRRVLKPGGLLYITIFDNDSIRGLTEERSDLTRTLECHKDFYQNNDFGMFAIGRQMRALAFYDGEYFRRMVAPMYEVVSITPNAYHIQSAALLRKL